jgi:hypothetical protein
MNFEKHTYRVYEELFSDLHNEEIFLMAVKKFCSEHREIYSGTNIVAYIRDAYKEEHKRLENIIAFDRSMARSNAEIQQDLERSRQDLWEKRNEAHRILGTKKLLQENKS